MNEKSNSEEDGTLERSALVIWRYEVRILVEISTAATELWHKYHIFQTP
jgi:hypothetical protein